MPIRRASAIKEGEHKVRALHAVLISYPNPVGANLVFALPDCVRRDL